LGARRAAASAAPTRRRRSRALPEALMRFGQKFMIAYDGLAMTPDVKEFCRRFSVGGVILFADNFADPAQLAAATAEIQAECAAGPPLFVACDHEGGRVQRFKTGFTRLPPVADLGLGDPDETRAIVGQAARELCACGVNLNFAPVADVALRDRPGAIGDRAFSSDPTVAARHVAAAVKAYQHHGVLACAKHFPGHGATDVDSHHALPSVARDANAEHAELAPFVAAIEAGVAAIMTAHVVYAGQREAGLPATFSSYWIREVLREQLRFKGLVFSDALEMTAIRDRWQPAEAGELAIRAGTDIVIFYLIEEQLRAVHDLCVAADRGRFDASETDASLSRIAHAKAEISACTRAL